MLPSIVAGSLTLCPVRGESFGSCSPTGGFGLIGSGSTLRLAGGRVEQNQDAVVAAQCQLFAVGAQGETEDRFGLAVVDLAFDHALGVPRLDGAVLAERIQSFAIGGVG